LSDFTIKKGDRLPVIEATLTDNDDNPADLTGASVRFIMRAPGATSPKVSATATVVDAAAGRVKYAWAGADVDTAGNYEAEWEVTFSGTLKETFPNDRTISVEVLSDLDVTIPSGGLGENYATKAELMQRLGMETADDDPMLEAALSAASRGVELCCDRQFNKTTTATTRTFRAFSYTHIETDDFHTTTGLVIATDGSGDGVYETTWELADYELEPLNGIVAGQTGWPYWQINAILSRGFPIGDRARVQVTAQWGWAAVPARVKEATLVAAEELYRLKDAPFGVTGFAEYGAVRVKANPFVAALLSPYRRSVVTVG
jgi:hypothetical protein